MDGPVPPVRIARGVGDGAVATTLPAVIFPRAFALWRSFSDPSLSPPQPGSARGHRGRTRRLDKAQPLAAPGRADMLRLCSQEVSVGILRCAAPHIGAYSTLVPAQVSKRSQLRTGSTDAIFASFRMVKREEEGDSTICL